MDRHCYQPVRDDARSSRPPRSRVAQKPCKLCEYESQTYVATSVSVRAASCNEKDENLFLRAEKRYCCGLVQGAGPISGPREPSCPPTANVATSTTESGGAACHGSGQRGPYCRASVFLFQSPALPENNHLLDKFFGNTGESDAVFRDLPCTDFREQYECAEDYFEYREINEQHDSKDFNRKEPRCRRD